MLDINLYSKLKFKYSFRKHQEMILDTFREKLSQSKGKMKFHVVAPPGSGKTIAGIQMIIELNKPALILCPNTAIQGQWVDKLKMFLQDDKFSVDEIISTDAKKLRLLNVFTYQALSIPENDDDLIKMSENVWAEYIASSHGLSIEEAVNRIIKMKNENVDAYKNEIAKFNKKIREGYLRDTNIDFFNILHDNTKALINNFAQEQIKTVVFDECHHLQSYWALVMGEVVRKLEADCVIGLTATPPICDDKEKLECYTSLLEEINFQIPTPAVVKEGLLAPYQDLVYFCTPSANELDFINNHHYRFKQLIAGFSKTNSDFYLWIVDRIVNRKLLTGEKQEWTKFINQRQSFAIAGVKYLLVSNFKLPWDITVTEEMYKELTIDDWCYLIEDYALNLLKVSSKQEDKERYENIKGALKNLGYALSEKGIIAYSSPIDRVLAYSSSKMIALKNILHHEMKSMGENIRAAIITDFEYSNVQSADKLEGVLNDETGGARSVLNALTSDEQTDLLDPVMVTSKSLICDNDLAEKYIELCSNWAKENGRDIYLQADNNSEDNYINIIGSGRDWNSKNAVLFTTYLLEMGVTKCIIGTRGLLGEGWDSINLNTLIDLSTVTTYATVNQLRGRSIRKSEKNPNKVSNNWDIICIAPELEKGYNDLSRLYRKHSQIYGICDDGKIQVGVNHIDNALLLSDVSLKFDEIEKINSRMLKKAYKRNECYKKWDIEGNFKNIELGCCDLKISKSINMKDISVFSAETYALNKKISATVMSALGSISSALYGIYGFSSANTLAVAAPFLSLILGYGAYRGVKKAWKYGEDNFFTVKASNLLIDFSKCLIDSLKECKLLHESITHEHIRVSEHEDGSVRVYLDGNKEDSILFCNSLSQLLSPIEDQRYAVQKYEVFVPEDKIRKFIYLMKYSSNKYPSVLTSYYPLPSAFGIKEKALVFQKYWNKYVSPGQVIYLKGENGQKIVENYGRTNYLGTKKQVTALWI